MRAGSGLCAGRESVLNAVPEGGSAVGLTATIGPWTRGEAGSGRSGTVFEFPICSDGPDAWLWEVHNSNGLFTFGYDDFPCETTLVSWNIESDAVIESLFIKSQSLELFKATESNQSV